MTNENILSLNEEAPKAATPNTNESGLTAEEVSALRQLVGKGKKFEDEEALARGKIEADSYIEQLKSEMKGLREDLSRALTEKQRNETKDELAALRKELSQRQPEASPKEDTPSPSDTEDLDSLIEKHITQRETQRSAEANVDQTNKALVEHYGDPVKASEAVKARLDELGLTTKDLTSMAAKSPSAALALVKGTSAQATGNISKTSSVRSVVVSEGQPQSVKAQFDQLRRNDPKKYWSAATQNQIFQLTKEGKYN